MKLMFYHKKPNDTYERAKLYLHGQFAFSPSTVLHLLYFEKNAIEIVINYYWLGGRQARQNLNSLNF